MRIFPSFFILEVKRFFCKRNIIIIFLFLLISLYFVQDGVNEYSAIIENKEKFKEIERTKVAQYAYFRQYGGYGFRLMFVPSPLSALFINSSVFSELISQIDAGEILKIYNSFKGRSLFTERSGGFKDFPGIILLFGSLFVLWLGAESFLNKEYLRFLSGFFDFKKIFRAILASKVMIVILFSLLLTGLSVLLLKFNHLPLGKNEYGHLLAFMIVMFLMLVFFLILGAAVGTLKSRHVAFVTIIVIWFGFIFFLPGIANKITAQKADNITSNYKLEFEKLRALMKFEKRAIEKEGKFYLSKNKLDSERELSESFWENEFKAIQELENNMAGEMKENILFYQGLSLFSPSTFYLSTNNEISSRGYDSVIAFYAYIRNLKQKFVRFYLDKIFSSEEGKVESFVKNEENIFYAKSRLPASFRFGVGLSVFYIFLLVVIFYFRFKSSLFCMPDKEIPKLENLRIKLEKGKCTACITSSEDLRNLIYNFFFAGREGFTGKIEINGVEVRSGESKEDLVYLCHPENIPGDIKVKDFVTLFKRLLNIPGKKMAEVNKKLNMKAIGRRKFNKLDDLEKGNVLFAVARLKKSKIYLINEIERGMPQNFTNGLMENLRKLKKEGETVILYLSGNLYFTAKVSEKMVVPGGERIENILK